MSHVIFAGSELLTMSESDALIKSFKSIGATVSRHPINRSTNWGEFVTDIRDSTHLFVVLGKSTDTELAGSMILAARGQRDPEVRVGLLIKDADALQRLAWLSEKKNNRVDLAVAFSSMDHSRLASMCFHSVLLDKGLLWRGEPARPNIPEQLSSSDGIARAFLAPNKSYAEAAE